MYIERLKISNFRCFGPEPETIAFEPAMTAFVGSNGAGKTAVMQAFLRLFGVSADQRRLRRSDFHVPVDEEVTPAQRTLFIEAILAFPELEGDDPVATTTVPEFFRHMATDEGGQLKCRLHLKATWTDDGSLEGTIEQNFWAVRTLAPTFSEEDDCIDVKSVDRARIQMIYVPAVRDGTSQVSAFLRGRLWRAITWSDAMKSALNGAGTQLNDTFAQEVGVSAIAGVIKQRWEEMSFAGTDAEPVFRPVDLQLEEFIKKVEVVFRPDETGRDRDISDLSDGQRSLFHIAMTAATLDIEDRIATGVGGAGFQTNNIALPALTLIAVEEPENNLAPFYLARIIRQIETLTNGSRAQALIASHSASILARVEPTMIRHFRLVQPARLARVKAIRLPTADAEAAKFVREAVRTYPELYFASFVVLGEGSSEEVVVPRIAEAMGLAIDRSFVAIVPIGGRHINHLWRLLADLEISHATLLDLDLGRTGGGWGRIKTVCAELVENGVEPTLLFGDELLPAGVDATLDSFVGRPIGEALRSWVLRLRDFGVFFCTPLDLDWSMLKSFPTAYRTLEPEATGPATTGDAKAVVLGDANVRGYRRADDDVFRWYRYLFLGRSKPTTHLLALGRIDDAAIAAGAPEVLTALINRVNSTVFPVSTVPPVE